MKFILVAVFVLNGGRGITFQEFDSKDACEVAIVAAKEMAAKTRLMGEDMDRSNQFRCVKK